MFSKSRTLSFLTLGTSYFSTYINISVITKCLRNYSLCERRQSISEVDLRLYVPLGLSTDPVTGDKRGWLSLEGVGDWFP